MIRTSFGRDRYVAGENDYIAGTIHSWTATQPDGVIFCHPLNGTATAIAGDASQRNLITALARHATVHAGDLAFDTCGNDLGVTRVGEAITYLRAEWGQAGPVVLVSISMGFTTATNYALRNPDEVAAVVGIVPAIDLADLMTRGMGLPEAINAAYGGTYNDSVDGPTHSPAQFADDLDPDLPIHLWTSSNDPYAVPAAADAFVAARPQTERTDLGAMGHGGVLASIPAVTEWVEQFTFVNAEQEAP